MRTNLIKTGTLHRDAYQAPHAEEIKPCGCIDGRIYNNADTTSNMWVPCKACENIEELEDLRTSTASSIMDRGDK